MAPKRKPTAPAEQQAKQAKLTEIESKDYVVESAFASRYISAEIPKDR